MHYGYLHKDEVIRCAVFVISIQEVRTLFNNLFTRCQACLTAEAGTNTYTNMWAVILYILREEM
jgi:hypothetical protein